MSEAVAQRPGSATDPVIAGCLTGLASTQTTLGSTLAEQYRFIETARARAIATADPMGRTRRIEEEFALRSITAELAQVFREHERTMTGLVYEAKQLGTVFTTSLASLAAGTVSQRHVREILAQAVTLPPDFHARFETEALAHAAVQTPTAFRRTAARIRERLHPDSLTVRAAKGRAERRLWFEPAADGMAWLHLHLEAEKAIAITERISHLADHAQAEALDTAGLPDTEVALSPETHAQLEADIAAELLLLPPAAPADHGGAEGAEGAVRSRMPGLAFSRPEVFVAVPKLTIPYATLIGQSDEPGELHGYGPIDADTARRLAANAPTLHRILVDPVDNTPLQLDPHKYTLNKAVRRWILYRDQVCRSPAAPARPSGARSTIPTRLNTTGSRRSAIWRRCVRSTTGSSTTPAGASPNSAGVCSAGSARPATSHSPTPPPSAAEDPHPVHHRNRQPSRRPRWLSLPKPSTTQTTRRSERCAR